MSTLILATAIELCKINGISFAAFYLYENGVAIEVALELLTHQNGAKVKEPLSSK